MPYRQAVTWLKRRFVKRVKRDRTCARCGVVIWVDCFYRVYVTADREFVAEYVCFWCHS
jgi:hypothetical protein